MNGLDNGNGKRLLWYNLAFMAFTAVWGFGNVINGFATYGGVRAVVPWLIIFILYFVPYSLMVGEMGSVFPEAGGGVSSWILKTIGPTAAFYAGWTYWIVHMPYISQKPNSILIAASWIFYQDARISQMSTLLIQGLGLVIFAIAVYLASRGMSFLKKISTVAGMAVFIMSLLYILMMWTAPAITGATVNKIDWSFSNFMPEFNLQFFTSFSILVFAVGGCEKISPYVNQMKSPSKDFPRGMIALAIMVAGCAILGTIAMGMMFDSNNIPKDLMTNGAYYAFQKLGGYYNLGNSLMVIYAVANFIQNVAVIIISIDAPLRMLLDNADDNFIPKALFKRNEKGVYTNGLKMISVIVGVLIIIPAFGIGSVDELVKWLIKVNSVCMPLRYLWVFVAYIALKKAMDKYGKGDYTFIKSKTFGIIVGGWCFAVTAVACVMGMYSEDTFQLIMNIVTPIVLVALGLIMPYLAKRSKAKEDL
ncbi:MAG: amino acid permease [Eubacterium aggregans]|uniref:Amino acid transporter n=1 Tax=Eubacterium aggregans TaxID=81409 RepID=A0A1H4BZE7_9FIRM|nr:amino acid permease [Eubacterium aggregans]MDD4690989.1 amino acid permease [Eubacterium aggregans]MEA5074145.1 amino acid permease [Eubacterium aggregans]SEA53528.1 Amino acid transporter [Eubacterium aggregans]